MISGQNDKGLIVIAYASIATSATTTAQIDTLGYGYCTIDIMYDSSATPSNTPRVMTLAEDDTTVVTNFTDITEFVGGTAFTIPVMTASAQMVRFNVDLRGRKRYLELSLNASAGAALIAGANAHLSRSPMGAFADTGYSATITA